MAASFLCCASFSLLLKTARTCLTFFASALKNLRSRAKTVYVRSSALQTAEEHNNSALFECEDTFSETAAACVYASMPVAAYKQQSECPPEVNGSYLQLGMPLLTLGVK